MSTRDRYTKIIESLVNGDEAKASELLHEAFVDQAREIWNDLVEADEVIEDELAEEDLEEAIRDEEADDFLDDIETDEDEIEAEEMYGESEDDDMDDLEAADELSDMDDEEESDDMEMDFDADGELDDHEEEHSEIEDKMMDVEDALEDLKKTFAELMGDMEDESSEEEGDEMDMEVDMEMEETFEEAVEEAEESEEDLAEAAELKKVGKDKAVHPVDMPDHTDGAAGPVGPGRDDPFAHSKDHGGEKEPVDMSAKGSEGSHDGLSDSKPKEMNVAHPGDGAAMKPETRGHGAEKKGK